MFVTQAKVVNIAGKCRGGAGNPEGIHGLWVGWVLTLLLCLFVCLFVLSIVNIDFNAASNVMVELHRTVKLCILVHKQGLIVDDNQNPSFLNHPAFASLFPNNKKVSAALILPTFRNDCVSTHTL